MNDEEERQLRAQAEMAEAAFAKDCASIEDLGRQTHGAQVWDEAVQTVTGKLGPEATRGFSQIVSQFDDPVSVVMHLSNNPGRLEALAKLPAARAVTEIARIEAEHHSATPRAGHEPQWKGIKSGGILSNDAWNNGAGDQLSEAQWQKNWEARQKDRASRSPQRLGSRMR
jgi:hypothetical protein